MLRNYSISGQQSSYDRQGKNYDLFQYLNFGPLPPNRNFIEVIKSGQVNNPGGTTNGKNEYVICKIQGPAVLERIWQISLYQDRYDAKFRFYFDGETTPRIVATDRELFSGNYSVFKAPSVLNFQQSSGGSISNIRMDIGQSLIVTVDSARIYYQFQYRQLPADSVVSTWTSSSDTGFINSELRRAGTYPKDNIAQLSSRSARVNFPAGGINDMFSTSNFGSIEGILLHIPALHTDNAYPLADSGRYHNGRSRFTLKIDPNASNYTIVKRMSKMGLYGQYTHENARVRVDNVFAGNWADSNYRDFHFWEDVSFTLPTNLCSGKSQITVDFLSNGESEWNEYYYWIKCDGVVTDSIDIGTKASEMAHNYTVTNPVISGFSLNYHNARYKTPEDIRQFNRRILDSLYIRIRFDDVETVECPVGMFFGTGINDAAMKKALPAGMVNDTFYNYFSMPFWDNAVVSLENRSSIDLNDIDLTVLTSFDQPAKDDAGYFYAVYNAADMMTTDTTRDYLVADVTGRGVLLGNVVEARKLEVGDTSLYTWLEGDERIFIDDMRSPIIHGTGTEDMYNGAFYFALDEMSYAMHGMTNSDTMSHRSMYRYYLTDPIYFGKNLTFKLEHGDNNNRAGTYRSIAFFYLQPDDTSYVLTDSMDVGDAADESLHEYAVLSGSTPVELASSYETESYRDTFSLTGRQLDAGSSFRVNILPDNDGARLMRTLYFAVNNQLAKVYVDSVLVGYWFTPGNNPFLSWKDDLFYIPAKYTSGKSSLKIRIENVNPTSNWTEMDYKVYTYQKKEIPTGIREEAKAEIELYPNPTSGKIYVKLPVIATGKAKLAIYSVSGILMLEENLNEDGSIDIRSLPSGTYLAVISAENGFRKVGEIVVQR